MEQDDCIITVLNESGAENEREREREREREIEREREREREREKSLQQVDIPIEWTNDYRSVSLLLHWEAFYNIKGNA